MRAELCCDALTMALGRRGPVPGLIHHSDGGQPVRRWRVSQADQKGEAYPIYEPQGPVPGQRTNGKLLCFTEKGTGSPATVQNTGRMAAIFRYIEVFYNRQRRHSAIGYQTPQQAFNNMTWKMAA